MSKQFHEEQIKNYIKEKSTRIFSNSNKDLFSTLLNTVFECSHNINWLIINLDKMKFYLNDSNICKIETFLKNGNMIKIITSKTSESILEKLEELNKKYSNFNLKVIDDLTNHQDILTWDNIGYRFSPDPKRLTGVACANDIDFTNKCNKSFNKIFNL